MARRFRGTILLVGAYFWYKGQDYLWWLGKKPAHPPTPGLYQVCSSLVGRSRTGQARFLFCSVHYGSWSHSEPFAPRCVYRCIKEAPSRMVVYATSTCPAELNSLALPTWTRTRSRCRFSHSFLSCSHRRWVRYGVSACFLSIWYFLVLCCMSFNEFPVDSCFHASRLLSSCIVGHKARLTPCLLTFSRAFLAFSFDRFHPLLETSGKAHSVFVPFLRPLSTVFGLS